MPVFTSTPRFALRKLRYGSLLAFVDAQTSHGDFVAALLPDPDLALSRGEVLPGRGRGCTTAVVTLAGELFVLKKYAYRGGWYGFRHHFKRSRALCAFSSQRMAWHSGVSTPEPLLCLERWGINGLGDSYVLSAYIAGSQTLLEAWDGLPTQECRRLLVSCATNLGVLHRSGIVHGDSNWRNFLVTCGPPGTGPVWLVDFDGSYRPLHRRRERFARDLGHFFRDMYRRQLPAEDVSAFYNAWCSTVGSAVCPDPSLLPPPCRRDDPGGELYFDRDSGEST